MFLVEARNNLFGSTLHFQSSKLYFWRLNALVFCCAANSEITGIFLKNFNPK